MSLLIFAEPRHQFVKGGPHTLVGLHQCPLLQSFWKSMEEALPFFIPEAYPLKRRAHRGNQFVSV